MTLRDLLGAPFLKDAKFWFALFNVVVIFAQRIGVTLTAQEIASVNLVIAVIFGIAPPTFTYMQQKRLSAAQDKAEWGSVRLPPRG